MFRVAACLKAFPSHKNIGWITIKEFKRSKYKLPALPYGYDSLEPVICREIMELHHKKHHESYVTNLTEALNKFKTAMLKCDIDGMVALENAIRFNGGGHINHSIFWTNYSPQSSRLDGELLDLIIDSFGSVQNMKRRLLEAGMSVEGSGWAWLAYNPDTGCLVIMTTANQDPLYPTAGFHPLLAVDVWEHAYYLQYLNKRGEYIKSLLEIINWDNVRHRYLDAKCGII